MNTNPSAETGVNRPYMQDDDIDVAQLLLTLWENKKWIVSVTAVFTLAGIVYALLAAPVYYSQATIALKETGKGGGGGASGILSQLGGMGGMVASQLGMGNTNLDKIEIILKGHELAEAVIEKNDLLPVLFPEKWDAEKGAWKPEDPKKVPTVRDGINKMRGNVVSIISDVRKNVIKVGVYWFEPAWAQRLVSLYLDELNNKIRDDIISDTEANREYLEKQLNYTRDPALIEKIQNMIAFEIEKSMLVSSQSFDVLENAIQPIKKTKPERLKIIASIFLIGLFMSVVCVFSMRYFMKLRKQITNRKSIGAD